MAATCPGERALEWCWKTSFARPPAAIAAQIDSLMGRRSYLRPFCGPTADLSIRSPGFRRRSPSRLRVHDHAAGADRLHLVLHLHGFHHHQALAGHHLVAGAPPAPAPPCRASGEDRLHGLRRPRPPSCATSGADRARRSRSGGPRSPPPGPPALLPRARRSCGHRAGRSRRRARRLHVGVARRAVAQSEAAAGRGREDLDACPRGHRWRAPVSSQQSVPSRWSASGLADSRRQSAARCGLRAAVCSAATSAATAARSGGGSGGRRRWKNSSMKPVCRSPARNSGSSRIWRKKPRLVWMPPTSYSRSARIMRAMACSRVSAQTASLASSGSYSIGTVQPS